MFLLTDYLQVLLYFDGVVQIEIVPVDLGHAHDPQNTESERKVQRKSEFFGNNFVHELKITT